MNYSSGESEREMDVAHKTCPLCNNLFRDATNIYECLDKLLRMSVSNLCFPLWFLYLIVFGFFYFILLFCKNLGDFFAWL